MARVLSQVAALTTVALVLNGCGGTKKSSGGQSEGKTVTIAGVPANDHGSKQVGGKTELELDDYYFEPTVPKGTPGSSVTLELKNEGKVEHNFSIDAQHIDKDLEADDRATVTVTMPQSGQLSFYCKYHKSRGMAGALTAGGTAGAGGGGGTTTGSTSTSGGGYGY